MKKIITLLFFIATYNLSAQAPDIQWQKSLGGSGTDVAYSIQQTTDGGYIVAGGSHSNNGDVSGNHGDYDYWVVKLDHEGNIQWQKSLGGSNYDYARSIQQTADGGYIVAGWSNSNNGDVSGNHGNFDYWVVKLDNTGGIQWQKSLGSSGFEVAYSVQQTTDGGYIVAGENGYYLVIKLDYEGNIQWQKSLGGSTVEEGRSIQQTAEGGYIVAGSSYSNDGDVSGNHGNSDYWVVKLNDTGNIQWQKCLGGSSYDYGNSVQQTTDGGYIVAGFSGSNDGDVSGNHGATDYWVVKLDTEGIIQWQKSLGGSDHDRARDAQQTADGGYIVVGESRSNDGDVTGNHGGDDYWVVKLNHAGNIQWQKSLGGFSGEEAMSIRQTADGGYIVAGYSSSNDGDVTGNHGNGDFWIVKLYPDNMGITEYNSQIAVYPNPVTTVLNISANEPVKSVTVFNLLGQEVMATAHFEKTLRLDISGLPTDLYFIQVTTEVANETFKVVKR